ncbi:hypothetical protein Tco_0715894 [Tanacetum coccineum]
MVKSWLVQDQTVLGKDYSNLLIADSLLKTIWFINAPCYGNEALASPKANGVCCDAEEMRCKFKIESEKEKSSGDKDSLGDDASKQGRINDIVADEDITLCKEVFGSIILEIKKLLMKKLDD